jgi:hypothetical protein
VRWDQAPHRLAVLLVGVANAGCAVSDINLPSDGAPARIEVVSGDEQEATVGSQLPDPLIVRLTDAAARPVPGAVVVFRFENEVPEAEIDPDSDVTDSTGQASARVRLGTTSGVQRVEARPGAEVAAGLRVTFDLTALEREGGGPGRGDVEGEDDKGKDKKKGHGHH